MFNFGFGGGGGGGGGRPQRPKADTQKLYDLLEIPKSATEADVKKAFRKQAMTHHPDKGGDSTKFQEIQRAYEILSDKDKRAVYDESGEEGLEGGGGGGGGGDMDIFDLFGGMGGRRRQTGPAPKRKGEDVVFPLSVTLEELYTGTSKKLRLTKNVLCDGCDGKGGKNVQVCGSCRGAGSKMQIRQLAPGMITQMQVQCSTCSGEGSIMSAKDQCKKCDGNKTIKEKKNLDVFIAKGAKHNTKQVFSGEADEAPDTTPGDVVVVLEMKPHPEFKREGHHLFIKKTITLSEALCGFQFTIETLDKRTLLIQSDSSVVKPGDFKVIHEEGMPVAGNGSRTGNLYIEFDVQFPDAKFLDNKTKEALSHILPKPKPVSLAAGAQPEQVSLDDVDIRQERNKFEREKLHEQQQEQEEAESRGEGGHRHGHGGGGPACRQA